MHACVYTRYIDYHCFAAMFSLLFYIDILCSGHKSVRKPLDVIISVSSLQGEPGTSSLSYDG